MSIERLRRSDGCTVYVVRWYESGRGSTKRKRTFDRLRGLASLRCGLEETERAQNAVVCLDEVVAVEAGELGAAGRASPRLCWRPRSSIFSSASDTISEPFH
jgi:hypothetical protein